nr:hypothetical protein [Tanacetum cinerariifolium]
EPPQDSDIHQLIEECSIEVLEEQKQKMEDRIALESKLLSINSQRLDKKEQEVKNVEEQPAEHTPILSIKEPENSLSMGYKHLSITPETESESNAKNLLPIPSKCEERLINLVENDVPDNSSNDPLLEEVDLFISDDSVPSEPPDDNFDLEPEVISTVMKDIDEPDEHFNPGGEIFVSTNNEDVDYFPFMFVIQIFLPYLILPEISPLFLSTESKDTIFDHGLSPED